MAGAAEIWAAWACMPVQVLAAHWQQPQAGPWAGPCTAPHRSAAQRSILLPQRSSAQLSAAQRSSAQLSAAYRSPEQTRHMLAGHLVGVCLLLAYRWSNGVHAQVHTFSAPCTVQGLCRINGLRRMRGSRGSACQARMHPTWRNRASHCHPCTWVQSHKYVVASAVGSSVLGGVMVWLHRQWHDRNKCCRGL